MGEPSQHFAVLCALWSFHNVRAEYQAAQAVAEQLLDLAQRQHDPALLLGAHRALGVTLTNVGAFALARTHLEQGIALYDPQRHATPHAIPGAMRNLRGELPCPGGQGPVGCWAIRTRPCSGVRRR